MPVVAEPNFDDTPAAVRTRMRANRNRDTGPELALRSALHRRGLRFRKHVRLNVGSSRGVRADIVFTRQRVAVFVDGCFWHGCPEHRRQLPKANDAYWRAKLARNVERDRRTSRALEAAGWRVVRVWEHESIEGGVEAVVAALGGASVEATRR